MDASLQEGALLGVLPWLLRGTDEAAASQAQPLAVLPPRERWAALCALALGSPLCASVQARVAAALRDEARLREPDAVGTRELVQLGAVDMLTRALRDGLLRDGSPKVPTLAVSALGNLAASAWAPAKTAICDGGGVESALACLALHGAAHPESAVQCCRALGNLCFGLDAAGSVDARGRLLAWKELLGEKGRAQELPEGAHDDGGGGSNTGAGSLPSRAAPCDAMRLILRVLAAHADRPDVVRWAAHALGNAVYGGAPNVAQDAALEAGVALAVVSAAAGHVAAHPKTAGFACEAVGNFVFRHPRARAAALAEPAAPAALVVETLCAHGATHRRSAEHACIALVALELPAGHRLAARAAQGVRASLDAWGGTSALVRRWGGKLVAALPAPAGVPV